MNNLIISCAGKSSRFPDMKPKHMLTHPDGKLMIEKAMEKMNLEVFDRIILILKPLEDCNEHQENLILEQVFKDNKKVELYNLPYFTKDVCEAINLTIEENNIEGSLVAKDCDNVVGVQFEDKIDNMVVGYDLNPHPEITNVSAKSFLILNEQNILQNIVEKKVVSNIICIGVYCFEKVSDFQEVYRELSSKIDSPLFVSHIISHMLSKKSLFRGEIATSYEDWGTIKEWSELQKRFRTYFVDVDGVIMKNCGKYGKVNWYNNKEKLDENIVALLALQEKGAQIVITTSRPEAFRAGLEEIFAEVGLKPYAILMGMNHASRIVINDFAPTNPYPSAEAITLPRNSKLKPYLR